MKRRTKLRLSSLVPALVSAALITLGGVSNAMNAGAGAVLFGAYDPSETLASLPGVAIDHVFVSWRHADAQSLRAAGRRAAERGRALLVTIEPWNGAAAWTPGENQSLSQVAAGAFDSTIAANCALLAETTAPVLVRWGHEMDEPNRYPWANQAGTDYVSAFRHFVDQCRRIAPRAKFVWSPNGNWTANAYYPGADYVDYVGLSDFDLEKWDVDHQRKARSFADSFGKAYGRVAGLGKPIIVAEFGVAGTDEHRRAFVCDALHAKGQFPLLNAVIYFNRIETYRWPEPYGSPDWRIPANLLSSCL